MPNPGFTAEQIQAIADSYNAAKGSGKDAAKIMGILPTTFRTRLHRVRATHSHLLKKWEPLRSGQQELTVEQLKDAADAYQKCGTSIAAAEYLGLHRATYESRLREARRRSDEI